MANKVIVTDPGKEIIIEGSVKTGTTITPGFLCALELSDGLYVVKPHASAGGVTLPYVALSREYLGKEVSESIAAGEQVDVAIPQRGQVVEMLLASGQDVAFDAALMSNGAGALTAKTSTNHIVAYAVEAVDATGGIARIKVRIA